MSRQLVEYRVFIGSPGGLGDERKFFREKIIHFNEVHGNPSGIVFAPIGWEDTLPGVGRPQGLINEDLRKCDYAVFILHDRWGSPTGSCTSGTEEECELAQELYTANQIRNICLFFKNVDAGKLADPGPQLDKVLAFKRKIESERKHLFQRYADCQQFCEILERHLAKWVQDHGGGSDGSRVPSPTPVDAARATPDAAEPSTH